MLIALLVVLVGGAAASAEERITGFRSDIEVRSDGSMRVIETIRVIAEGDQIRHGIYRDIPTLYRSRTGENYRVGFEVTSVERDGSPEPYIEQGLSNGQRIRIGSAESFVAQGEHTYRIAYDVDGVIGFFKDYDELYWNVNGTGWDFSADKVEAWVNLPAGARILDYTAYTGTQGATEKAFRAGRLGESRIQFETTRPLSARENLTIVVTWPKGIVAEPTRAQRTQRFLAQNLPIFTSGLGFLILLGYYMSTWLRVGKDPPPGTIMPLFHPPKDLSPAAVRFIRRMGYDRKAFTAALIDMAVKGYLRIEDDGSKFELVRTGNPANLSAGEKRIGDALFSGARSIKMTNAHHAKFGSAVNRLREALENEHQKSVFVRNQIYFWIGVAITIAVAAITALLSPNPEETIGGGLMISVWVGITAFVLTRAFSRIQSGANSFGSRVAGVFQVALVLIFAVPFVFAALAMGTELAQHIGLWAAAFLALTAALNIVFFELLKAPTVAGRKLMDEIEGLAMYLGTAERHRLDMLTPPEDTPEQFEKMLPYAIALDVENEWNQRFESVFAAAAQQPGSRGYSPAWYSGPRLNRMATGGFAGALGGALASAAASAATAPGSSSGMSGGSSGGGGGGGGGGGW